MKPLASIFLAIFLVACSTPPTPPVPPPSPPAPVVDATYVIREFDSSGILKHEWTVKRYTETQFPHTVTFTVNGEVVTLRRSYEIRKLKTP